MWGKPQVVVGNKYLNPKPIKKRLHPQCWVIVTDFLEQDAKALGSTPPSPNGICWQAMCHASSSGKRPNCQDSGHLCVKHEALIITSLSLTSRLSTLGARAKPLLSANIVRPCSRQASLRLWFMFATIVSARQAWSTHLGSNTLLPVLHAWN